VSSRRTSLLGMVTSSPPRITAACGGTRFLNTLRALPLPVSEVGSSGTTSAFSRQGVACCI